MKETSCGRFPKTSLYLGLVVLMLFFPGASDAASRDVIWDVVTSCIDTDSPDYCTRCPSPRTGSSCAEGRDCRGTTEVWGSTSAYVVIRDRKMCGCPEGFTHGLVIPRARVTGVEDAKRPAGIWDFAWKEAKNRIAEESEIALAINPAGQRSQDQLHIHIVRLLGGIRGGFDKAATARVRSLDYVWETAANTAQQAGLRDYGVLVIRHGEEGFMIVVDEKSIEKEYTQWKCR